MSIYLYTGGFSLVKRSGVGQAIMHQHQILKKAGMSIDHHFTKTTTAVHINTVFPDAILLALWAHLHRVKVIYYAHSTMEDFRCSFRGSNLLASTFKKWLIFCYKRGDIIIIIITPTPYSKRLLESYGINRPIYVLSNGFDCTKFYYSDERREAFRKAYHISESTPVVMSVGLMIERKGLLDFIALACMFPGVRFFYFGQTSSWMIPKNISEAIKNAPENISPLQVIFPKRICKRLIAELIYLLF